MWSPYLLVLGVVCSVALGQAPGKFSLDPTVPTNFRVDPCVCVPQAECTAPSRQTVCPNRQVCCPINKRVKQPATVSECGKRKPYGYAPRLGAGADTFFGEFPWMAAIMRVQVNGSAQHQCGGALIHPEVVLTAAHCVTGLQPGEKLLVRLGEHDMLEASELEPYVERQVRSTIVHPQYHGNTLRNDVALLALAVPVSTDKHIGVVCLASEGGTSSRQQCMTLGWGTGSVLKRSDVRTIAHYKCQELLQRTPLYLNYTLHESHVCAGTDADADPCEGDGGAPLVCHIPGSSQRYEQVGIVSWTIRCGEPALPGVYSQIAVLRPWIDNEINKLGYTPQAYSHS